MVKNEILEDFTPGLEMAGLGVGTSVLGGAFEQFIPAGVSNPLTTTGRVVGQFTGPVVAIGALNVVGKQFKKLDNKLKGGKK